MNSGIKTHGFKLLALSLITILIQLPGPAGLSAAAAPGALPAVGVTPAAGPAGAAVEVFGSGYVPGGYGAVVRWDGVDQFSFTVPSGGSFKVPFTIPGSASAGGHTIT